MKTIHIVSHTHWDREWHKPFEVFRSKLVFVVDRLLRILDGDPAFRHFMLDGQTIVLEDYLAIRPEQRTRLKNRISEGRIGIGPWYVQPDEFAPDGESLVRNLLIGIRQAREYGPPMMIGYLPDSFGQTSQMPQILKGFGIDAAVVMRGVDFDAIESTEFIWEGLNGDRVLGIYLMKGYFNAMFLSSNKAINKARIERTARELGPWASTGHLLIMNGMDHAFPQAQVSSLCGNDKGWTQGSLEEYVDLVKRNAVRLKTLRSDLLVPRHHRVHAGISSTRIDQKKTNRELSIAIERVVEPVCVLASLHGPEYPQGLIGHAWKTLLRNQTHDGIGGCCTDEVHREMDRRFLSVRRVAETLTNQYGRALARAIGSGKDFRLIVFNTALRSGPRLITATVFVDDGFRLVNERNEEVACQIIGEEEVDVSRNSIWTVYLGTEQKARRKTFVFLCDFPMVLGYRSFRIVPAGHETEEPEESSDLTFGNEYYALTFNDDGSLSVLDKETGFVYPALNVYEDTGEGGDTYNHSPLREDTVVLTRSVAARIERIEKGPLRQVFRVRQVMDIPESLSADGRSRSGKTVPVGIETRVCAYGHSRRMDFSVTIDNSRARSHRLRALFPFGDRVDDSLAETHFGVIERKNTVAPGGKDWPEKPLPIFSMQRFAGIRNNHRSLFIINRGLQEYEIYQREDSVLAITLHRGVGMMGKADLEIRPGRPSGIEIPTPDAESPGMLAREYALIVGGKIPLYEVAAEADRFTSPSLAVQNRINIENIERAHKEFFRNLSVDTVTSILAEQLKDVSSSGGSYITLTGSRLSVSAVKKAETDDSIILRVFNAGEQCVRDETMRLDFPHRKVFVTNLLEEEQTEIPGDRDYVLPVVNPNCQLTLKIARQAWDR